MAYGNDDGVVTFREDVAETFGKTKDALLVTKELGNRGLDRFLLGLILKEAQRRKAEREKE